MGKRDSLAMPQHDVATTTTTAQENSTSSSRGNLRPFGSGWGKMEMKMKIFIISVPKRIKIVCVYMILPFLFPFLSFFSKNHRAQHNAQYPHEYDTEYIVRGNMACEMKASETRRSTIRRRRGRSRKFV